MYLKNPLDEFNTYSVHYVMLACRTTTTAKEFASENEESMKSSLAAIDAVKALGQPVILGNNATDVFLLLDTRRFSQFTVESLRYDVLINGLQKGAGPSNLAVDLSMTILDTIGISFANYMQWLMDVQMKTNYDGLIFMLRTIFVGHKPDGTSETVQSETIPMHLNKMEINLDYAKGAYNLEFMPNMNFDVKKYNRFLSISLATSYRTGKGNKLGDIVNSLEKELNEKSAKFYKDVQDLYTQANTGNDVGALGRPVQYMITLPKGWGNFEVLGSTIGGASELKFFVPKEPLKATDKATTATKDGSQPSGQATDSITAVRPSLGIPDVLDIIFKQVPEIAKLGNFNKGKTGDDGNVTFFKHIVGLTSDDNSMMVHVDVVEFKVPNIIAQDNQKPKKANTTVVGKSEDENYRVEVKESGIVRREPKNFIEFDYIFTGKNKDILNFDMKIQDFQFLLASNLRMGDNAIKGVADNSGQTDGAIDPTKNNDLLYTRKYDPILMPVDTKAALDNFSKNTMFLKSKADSGIIREQSQQYTKNLSMFYAGSPITVALTIKGNPDIMHKFNVGKILNHQNAVGNVSNADRITYRENLESEILRLNSSLKKTGSGFIQEKKLDEQLYAVAPVFVKINISGPTVDFRTNEPLSDTSDFNTSVLSDNYYAVFKVTNIIQGHQFTQELELYAHNLFGTTKITKDANSSANPATYQK